MNYQELYQQSLAARQVKKVKIRGNKLTLGDLGKVVNGNVREGAFRHFSNILQSFRQRHVNDWKLTRIMNERKKIISIATQWNFELPDWF